MRYEKAEIVHRIALDMQSSLQGLSLEDIRRNYSEQPLSRRTAERLRDAVDRIHMLEHANPGEPQKRWRIPRRSHAPLSDVTARDLGALATAAALLKRENLAPEAKKLERVAAKLRAQLKPPTVARLETDLEVLTEAEGVAMRPGPRPNIDHAVVHTLRDAILAFRKVRLDYRYRSSGKKGHVVVHPYGFLYGSRHYLVA